MSDIEKLLTSIIDGEPVTAVPQSRTEQFLTAIANKEGTENLPEPTCRVEELYEQIAEQFSVETILIDKNITESGVYSAVDEGVDGYLSVTVDVPLIDKTITENGTYAASNDNVSGYSTVTVDVEPTLIDKVVTEIGTYSAIDDGVDGYSSITVDIATENFKMCNASQEITEDGSSILYISEAVTIANTDGQPYMVGVVANDTNNLYIVEV